MRKEELERRLIEDKNKFGLLGSSLKVLSLRLKIGHISENISVRDWTIEIKIDPEWQPDEYVKHYLELIGENPNDMIYIVARDLLNHAAGHWEYPYRSRRGCPYNIEHHELIADATMRALRELGKIEPVSDDAESRFGKRKKIPFLVTYVANAFEDFCINPNIAFVNGGYPGVSIFFYDQGISNKGKFTPFYEAFVKLNMELYGTDADYSLLSRFYENSEEVKDAVKSVISEFSLGNNLEKNVKILFYKASWDEMAYRFAYHMGKLLDEKLEVPKELLLGESNPFDEKLEDPVEVGRLLVKRHKEGREAPSYLTPFESLDLFYQRLAAEIPVIAETSRKSLTFPLVYYGYETFNKDKHNPEDINPTRIGLDIKDKKVDISFQVPKYHLDIQVPAKEFSRGFPDIAYIIDTSYSMLESIDGDGGKTIFNSPWRDRSKYHYALLGLYGSLKYIETRKISPFIRYEIFNFSDKTLSLGRPITSRELFELKKLALSPQFNGTKLDIDKLKSEIYKEPSVVIMLSDGEIYNWDDIKRDFKKLVEPHLFSFISIGSSSSASNDIKNWGKPVYKVEKGSDITRLMIDLTKHSYRPWLKS